MPFHLTGVECYATKVWVSIRIPQSSIQIASKGWKGKTLKVKVLKLCLAASIYVLWTKKNARVKNLYKDSSIVLKGIIKVLCVGLILLCFKTFNWLGLHSFIISKPLT